MNGAASSKITDRRPLILVVDDDSDARGLLLAALSAHGMAGAEAADGDAAQRVAVALSPDIVLMDALMPGRSGFEVCRALKADPRTAAAPVIFMTALSETEHVLLGLNSGGVDYVTKPIVLDELFARIRVHLANAQASLSARRALDAVGRSLFTTDRAGALLWSTPQAAGLLSALGADAQATLTRNLADAMDGVSKPLEGPIVRLTLPGRELEVIFLTQTGHDEFFFRISEIQAGGEQATLRAALGLTQREADVLLWVARGKSNRDTSQILNISPRTVNKHLEQVFEKLGVENRAAATAVAIRTIAANS